MVKTRKPETRMIAAECARRTGLTVRALRLYERLKLIKPSRSAKGWRLYGPEELIRLNTIVALKNFGLSLKQIRKVFSESQPELSQVLDMQIKVWASRKLAADRAIGQIRSALAHMATRAPLSIDELCELLRSSDMSNVQTITRELINQYITPEQEREWLSYWAQRPEEAADSQARFREWRAIAQEFLAVMRNGAPPDSPKAQALVECSQKHWLKDGMRERHLEQYAWNPQLARAWSTIGRKLMSRSVVPDDPEEAERLSDYMMAARRVSPAAMAFRPLAAEAAMLRANGVAVTSAEARKLARRFAELCREFQLGDPEVHARWVAAFAEFDPETREIHEYMARVVAA